MLVDLYSQRNLQNSIAVYLGQQLVAFGYLVYFLTSDLLLTPDGAYPRYSTDFPTYALDSVFAPRLAAAKGLITLHDGETAFPRVITRPTSEGTVGTQAQVQVPVFGVTIDEDVVMKGYELGTRLKWRHRALQIDGRARDKDELVALQAALEKWFDEETSLVVTDHDGTSGELPGSTDVLRRTVSTRIVPGAGDQDRFQLELHARLEHVS